MPSLLTQAEFAERHGVGKPAVTAWKKRGLLIFVPDPNKPGKQLIDAEKSDLLVRGTIDQTRGRPRKEESAPTPDRERSNGPASGSLEAARLDEMVERTTRRRIENEQLLGRLVPLAEYERRAGDMGRVCRERVHGLIRQLSERLAAETDPRAVMTLLGDAVDGVFAQLADEIEAAVTVERAVDGELAALEDEEEVQEGEDAE